MKVTNIHACTLPAPLETVEQLVATLSSDDDQLWPRFWWPAMRFDRPLSEGAVGGHGPIRYTVERYEPHSCIVFRFTGPEGFNGTHAYYFENIDAHHTQLRHELIMTTSGVATLSWPLVFRPLHDALIEDSFQVAAASLSGQRAEHADWSAYVRFLRWLFRRRAS